jgi:predicted nucleic acid-binding protein
MLVVDTGVFSAALSARRRPLLAGHVARLTGNQAFLAAVTVAELRYGALVAGWGRPARRAQLERAITATTVIPVTDAGLN